MFHMFTKLNSLKPYLDIYHLNDVNAFARHVFSGKMWFGSNLDFNKKWKNFLKNSDIPNMTLKFEGTKSYGFIF